MLNVQYLFGDKSEAHVYVAGRSHDNVGYVTAAGYVYAAGYADEVMRMYADGNVYVSDVENSVHLAVDVLDLVRPIFNGTKTPRVRSHSWGGFTRGWGHQLPTPALVELYQL